MSSAEGGAPSSLGISPDCVRVLQLSNSGRSLKMSLAPREQTKTSKTPGPASKAEVTTPDPGTLTRAHTHTHVTQTHVGKASIQIKYNRKIVWVWEFLTQQN